MNHHQTFSADIALPNHITLSVIHADDEHGVSLIVTPDRYTDVSEFMDRRFDETPLEEHSTVHQMAGNTVRYLADIKERSADDEETLLSAFIATVVFHPEKEVNTTLRQVTSRVVTEFGGAHIMAVLQEDDTISWIVAEASRMSA